VIGAGVRRIGLGIFSRPVIWAIASSVADSKTQQSVRPTAAKRRSLAARIALAFGSALLTIAVLELLFRSIMPASTHHLMYQESTDPALGVELVPGADFEFTGVTIPIPPTRVVISNQGLRDVEIVRPKPAGRRRLLCLGDSTTFGWGVEMEEGFCYRLNGLLGRQWNTVNLGVPGYNTSQEVRRLETVGLSFEPDVVMVLFDGNDYQPPLDYGGADSWTTWLTDRSALVQWIRKRLRGGGGTPEDEAHHDAGIAAADGGPARGPSEGPAWDGKAAVLNAFTQLIKMSQTQGFRLLVLMPNSDEDQELRRLLDRYTVPYQSMRDALMGPPNDVLIPEDNHPNAEGHARIARLAARILRERNIIAY